jgi:uncharacterized damage-inducible protein DinB
MSTDLAALTRDSLIAELESLRDAVRELAADLSNEQFWRKPLEPGNSIGHLVLHLTGNLKHFVGAQLGGTGYVRDREREFTEAAPPAKDVALAGLEEAVGIFRKVVSGLSAERLASASPEARFGTVLKGLVHLVAHFALHRGQMSYLKRLVQAKGSA